MLKPGARLLLGLLLVSGGVVAGRLAWAGQIRGVHIRVLNNSDYDFQELVVNDVSFGSLTKYRGSDYHELNGAYHYGAVSFEVNDKTFTRIPSDYYGETPLSPGRYTYMVSIDYETGASHTTFFEGDQIPKGEQAPGRNRILDIKHTFEVTDAKETTDHGFIISGSKSTTTHINLTVSTVAGSRVIYLPKAEARVGRAGAMLARTDATGNKRWLQVYGQREGTQTAKAVVLSPDGGYMFAGRDEFKEANGWRTNAWLVKVDAQGRQLWSKHFGDSAFGYATSLQTSLDGGFIVAGMSSFATLLFKVDALGQEQWRRLFSNDDQADFVLRASDGGYIIVGHVYRHYGNNKSWIIKTDALGNERWTHRFEGMAVGGVEASGGAYVVVGNTKDSGGRTFHGLLVKVDARGNRLWDRQFAPGRTDWLAAIAPASDGGFALAGNTSAPTSYNRDFWLIKVDSNGQPLWQQTFDKASDDEAHAVVHTDDGGYLLVGTTDAGKVWMIKTNSTGLKEWDQTIED